MASDRPRAQPGEERRAATTDEGPERDIADVGDGRRDDDGPGGYTLTELAERSGVSERTIRYYQSEKLLPKPVKMGRERRYGDDHLQRIALIVELRDRGLTLHTIRDLVDNDDPARTVASWLGIDEALRVPWSDDRPQTVGFEDLRGLVGDMAPGLLAELHDAGYTRSNPDGTWTIPSPALLELALGLRRSGVDVETAGHIRDLLRKRLARAVDETVDYLVKRRNVDGQSERHADETARDELVDTLVVLRPIAGEMTGLILAQEVERALGTLVTDRAGDLARSQRRATD